MPHMQEQPAVASEQTFVPASLPLEQSQRKVPLTTRERPDLICGVAHRVGRAGLQEDDPPIYRLKLKTGPDCARTTVLPGFFVLKRGVFIPEEKWRRRRRG